MNLSNASTSWCSPVSLPSRGPSSSLSRPTGHPTRPGSARTPHVPPRPPQPTPPRRPATREGGSQGPPGVGAWRPDGPRPFHVHRRACPRRQAGGRHGRLCPGDVLNGGSLGGPHGGQHLVQSPGHESTSAGSRVTDPRCAGTTAGRGGRSAPPSGPGPAGSRPQRGPRMPAPHRRPSPPSGRSGRHEPGIGTPHRVAFRPPPEVSPQAVPRVRAQGRRVA